MNEKDIQLQVVIDRLEQVTRYIHDLQQATFWDVEELQDLTRLAHFVHSWVEELADWQEHPKPIYGGDETKNSVY